LKRFREFRRSRTVQFLMFYTRMFENYFRPVSNGVEPAPLEISKCRIGTEPSAHSLDFMVGFLIKLSEFLTG
jgi:hypothetical protein